MIKMVTKLVAAFLFVASMYGVYLGSVGWTSSWASGTAWGVTGIEVYAPLCLGSIACLLGCGAIFAVISLLEDISKGVNPPSTETTRSWFL